MEPTHDHESTPNPASQATSQESPSPESTDPVTAMTESSATSEGKADLGKRFIAMLIDGVIAFVFGLIPFVGGIAGAAYYVVRDGLEVDFMDRRSVGKKFMKLRPVRLDGQPMDIETSARRNWMWGLGAVTSVLAWIPIIGWLLLPVVGLIALGLGLFEIFKVLTDSEGRRWGDTMAGTKVIEVPE